MFSIATLTMNPAVDLAYEVEKVVATHKLRASGERYNPGGGGINVARIFVRLGGNARCHYPSGGPMGVAFDGLVDLHQLVKVRIPIAGNTRASAHVFERSTRREFRFVPEGPELSEAEWQACLDSLKGASGDYVVVSGSLPHGVPDDFYARAGRIARESGARFVLDSSGAALACGLAEGGVEFVKPSESELSGLVGSELRDIADIKQAACEIVASGKARIVAVTMGERGAVLAVEDRSYYLPAVPIEALSAVGAGDSFVAAMTFRLCAGDTPEEAFRFAIAAGSAAVLTPGTQMCMPEDIARLLPQVLPISAAG